MWIVFVILMFSLASFSCSRFAADLTEQSGSSAAGWRTRNPPGSELPQGHVQRGIAQWQNLVSDPSRKNPKNRATRWPEAPLQVYCPLVGGLKPQTCCMGLFALRSCLSCLPEEPRQLPCRDMLGESFGSMCDPSIWKRCSGWAVTHHQCLQRALPWSH